MNKFSFYEQSWVCHPKLLLRSKYPTKALQKQKIGSHSSLKSSNIYKIKLDLSIKENGKKINRVLLDYEIRVEFILD